MTDVVLVYPYSNPPNGNSDFRFPPLGLAYLAAYLRKAGRDFLLWGRRPTGKI